MEDWIFLKVRKIISGYFEEIIFNTRSYYRHRKNPNIYSNSRIPTPVFFLIRAENVTTFSEILVEFS